MCGDKWTNGIEISRNSGKSNNGGVGHWRTLMLYEVALTVKACEWKHVSTLTVMLSWR